MTTRYYNVIKGGKGEFLVVTPAGVVEALCYGEVAAHRICDLLNWYHDTTVNLEWGKWHNAKDVRATMLQALRTPPPSLPKPSAAPKLSPPVLRTPPALPASPGPALPTLPKAPNLPPRLP